VLFHDVTHGAFMTLVPHTSTREIGVHLTKGSYSDWKRTLKWVLLVTVPRTVLDATALVLTRSANDAGASTDCVGQAERKALRTASVRQDHRQYCVLVLRTHPVGSVVVQCKKKERSQ
jgi:hypothetical protein